MENTTFDFSRGPDLCREKVEKVYSEQISQGYRFTTNVETKEVEKYSKKYEEKGFEVFVGDKAFRRNGKKDPSMKCILTRKLE
ncbi:MAG: hypothetical protein WC812_01545 [Candidatus Pacearchaeota archaeon]|jgi:hypothetical protein